MSRAQQARLERLEAAKGPAEPITTESIRIRAAELRSAGLEHDEAPTEFGNLFSPSQLCEMDDICTRHARA